MIRACTILVMGLLLGCKGTAPTDAVDDATPVTTAPGAPGDACCAPETTPNPDATPATDAGSEPALDVPDVEDMTAASLYASCRDRVEMPEADGECKTSADCGSGGCGGEMCVATSHGTIMSTCEVRACFSVLDQCGCLDGRCVWSIKDAVPEGRRIPISPG